MIYQIDDVLNCILLLIDTTN